MTPMDNITEENFSYEGYQVVRGEFFAHINEPSITFNGYKFNVNSACLNKMPQTDYIHILVNPAKKKLVIRPCSENDKDSQKCCNTGAKTGKRNPRYITCKMFCAKIAALMNWDPDYRYKLLGKLIKSDNEFLFIFDLTAFEMYERPAAQSDKAKNNNIPVYPSEWKNQFGMPYEEHRKSLKVNVFDGYAVFSLSETKQSKTEASILPTQISFENEVECKV